MPLQLYFLNSAPVHCIGKTWRWLVRPSRLVINHSPRRIKEYFLDSKCMRKFLYSKWFFGFLAVVCALDLISDAAADFFGWGALHEVTIGLELISVYLSVAMFLDLHRRMKVNGRDPRG